VEFMRGKGWEFRSWCGHDEVFNAVFENQREHPEAYSLAEAPTAPEAICRAALAALGDKQ